jgi:P27 family predicted phage terminase small subunit
MGKRGPAPEPSILKYIRGNPSKGALPKDEPTPELLPDGVKPPEGIPPRAIEKWKEAAAVLSRMRVLTEADTEPLTRYCMLWERFIVNYEKSLKMGEEITHYEPDPNFTDGRLRIKWIQVAPWVTQYRTLARELLRLEQEFGLTPSSRSQVSIHSNQADDPLRAFAKKRSS